MNETHIPKIFEQSIQNSFVLYLFQIYLIQNICKQAKLVADKIQTKYVPSEEDKNFAPVLYENELIQNLAGNKKLQKLYEKYGFAQWAENDVLKKIYDEFAKEDWYKKYSDKAAGKGNHIEILLELFRFLRKSKLYNEIVEDHLYNWEDDDSLIIGAVKKTLKSLPATEEFYKEYMLTETETLEFGRRLLHLTIEQDEDLAKIIKPTLKNWDADRVAIIDMIFIKMAIIEFLNFETIPTNATLNEYVELSKLYSTPKSKEFINGVLDKIMKDLMAKNLIKKEGRGLVQES